LFVKRFCGIFPTFPQDAARAQKGVGESKNAKNNSVVFRIFFHVKEVLQKDLR